MARVLVVEDEPRLREAIATLFQARGFVVTIAASGEEALDVFEKVRPDVALLDVLLPGLTGPEVFRRLRQVDPSIECVFVTAHGTISSAVEAMRTGAFDYLTKPFDNDQLVLTVQRALERRELTAKVVALEADLSARSEFSGIVGRSLAVQQVLRRLAKVAGTDTTVLLSGETGTGKELVARSLHRASPRKAGPFVAINCAAIPVTLAEAELFGHARGAFTDAKSDRAGRFEQARGGTLFLDEVGELAGDLQTKLLRAIQEREIHRVGEDRVTRTDVRLVAATNRDLDQDVTDGRFREDLFWRLNVFRIEIPPLRQRREDLPLLVGHLLDRIAVECRVTVGGLAPAVMDRFRTYDWPGNVRELANVLQHAVIMAESPIIQLEDVPEYLTNPAAAQPWAPGQLEQSMAIKERQLVEATLERFRGNRSAAAEALGIDRRTLYAKLRRYQTDDGTTPRR